MRKQNKKYISFLRQGFLKDDENCIEYQFCDIQNRKEIVCSIQVEDCCT